MPRSPAHRVRSPGTSPTRPPHPAAALLTVACGWPGAARAAPDADAGWAVPGAAIAIALVVAAFAGLRLSRRMVAGARRTGGPAGAPTSPDGTPVGPPPDATPPRAAAGPPPAPREPSPGAASAAADVRDVLAAFRRLSRDVYWEQDADGRITRVDDGPVPSPLALRIGRCRWDDGALPLDAPDWDAHRQRLARGEPFVECGWAWTDDAGRLRVAIDSGMPRRDAAGRVVAYVGVSRDAGAHALAERARRLATAALLAADEPVLWIEALDGGRRGWRVVWANGSACRLFDRTERELHELPDATLFGPASARAAEQVDAAVRGRRALRLDGEIARKYGETRSVTLRVEPLPGAGAMRPCAALLLHDRSAAQQRLRDDTRAIEQLKGHVRERSLELEVTAKELESFTYTVSHDLRAPIRVIDGFARILQEDYADRIDKVGHDHLQRILGAASRMTRMIDALLGLSRLSGQPMAAEPVDLSRLADTIVEELRAQEPDRRVSVSVQPGMVVDGDRVLLRAMLENLLGNAWKYTQRRGDAVVEFSCTGTGPATVYRIRDNGEGFDMRFADRLFGVFQRLHSTTDFPGTGVGLATVQRIVRRHGGRVWAEGEPGRGARFYFTLGEKPAR